MATSALLHLLGKEFAQHGRRFDVQRYDTVDFFGRSSGQRIEDQHPSIIYQNVDCQALLAAEVEQFVCSAVGTQILVNGINGNGVSLTQFVRNTPVLLLFIAYDYQIVAGRGELRGITETDAGTRTGDQCRSAHLFQNSTVGA